MVAPVHPSAAPSGATALPDTSQASAASQAGGPAAPRRNGHAGPPQHMPGSFAARRPDSRPVAAAAAGRADALDAVIRHFSMLQDQASMDRLSLMSTGDNPMPRLNGAVMQFPTPGLGGELDDASSLALGQRMMTWHMLRSIEGIGQEMLNTIKDGKVKDEDA
ncbi:hypothetical protein [Burkholderia glumae]|uniref:hypothetical protein n=1 Tax=Burkholderia glumae TaxID=337 RepID=UPI001F3C614F|nr:hypothetical protein [Burkholderia glumae]MCQ0029328.1 hypothetical protein [Burkholderia glumae]MCQ0036917.1 hypothetical protein [Burkholderia glumae]QKM48048.1 hypothetical protein B7760_02082 [Burkholderia glumae]